MAKIRNKNFVVSPGIAKNNVIKLLDVKQFKHTGSHFTGYIQEEDSLRRTFDKDTSFFYTLETFDNTDINSRKLNRQEKGLAHVKKVGKDLVLIREVALSTNEQGQDTPRDEKGFFELPDDSYVVIGSYIPTNYIDLFYRKHSILCSTDELSPSPIELEKNSLLGRLEGEVQSLNSDDISLILSPDYVVKSLYNNNDPILISSDHVELTSTKSKLLISQIVLKATPRKPRNKEQGTIIFNSSSNSLEFYDGDKWRKIKTED